jgi:hypothetical protein
MSCGGNRFQCGIGRFNKFVAADKPSNQELHNENQKKLSDLMRLREEQDKGNFSFQPQSINPTTSATDITPASQSHFTPFSYNYSK